jgi:tight adherence protein B
VKAFLAQRSGVLDEQLFGLVGMLLTALALAFTAYCAMAGDTLLHRYYRRYTAHLDRQLRSIFVPGSGHRIALGQLAALFLTAALGLCLDVEYWYVLLALPAILPPVYLARKRAEHVRRLEGQADALVLGLANALKTVPSPSAAMASLAPVLPIPMRLEIDRLLKEMRVGSTLEQALLNLSARVKSPDLDTALSSLLIGLQVGGNLPVVLENTAATIREMARLQGVVRTKTSEARAQLWVLALFPFLICYAFAQLDPDYFTPLQRTFIGTLITAVSVILWMASLMAARRILKVDI